MKKQGVKRPKGKCRGENYYTQLERVTNGEYQKARSCGQIMESDIMCVALKRMGLLGPKRVPELDRTVREVRREFARIVVEEADDDPEIWHAKAKFDEELLWAVGEEYFVPWEVRHDLNLYSDGVRVVELANAWHKAEAEVTAKRKAAEALEASKRELQAKFKGKEET